MRAYVGIGSNLASRAGGPRETVAAALLALGSEPGIRLVRSSAVYRTEPVGRRQQPEFANAAAEVETELDAERLLERLLALERWFGRAREAGDGRDAPRTLDLDLLLAGQAIRRAPGLTLPHPRLHERRFVLVPLAEIAPGLVHPTLGRSIGELLSHLRDPAAVEPWDALVRDHVAHGRDHAAR